MKKRYVGSISNEIKAAAIYDQYAILAHGLRAKLNFSYTGADVQAIIDSFNVREQEMIGKKSIDNAPIYQIQVQNHNKNQN